VVIGNRLYGLSTDLSSYGNLSRDFPHCSFVFRLFLESKTIPDAARGALRQDQYCCDEVVHASFTLVDMVVALQRVLDQRAPERGETFTMLMLILFYQINGDEAGLSDWARRSWVAMSGELETSGLALGKRNTFSLALPFLRPAVPILKPATEPSGKRKVYSCIPCRSSKMKCDRGKPSCEKCKKETWSVLGTIPNLFH
jgi:Fungal Zn(2)-Cys(6) binuclear cluster domain